MKDENKNKDINCDLTPLEKEYLNSLLELRLKEYDAQFKRLCNTSSPGSLRWKNTVEKLGNKCNFVLKLREKLGFIEHPDELSLDEMRDIVRGLENE